MDLRIQNLFRYRVIYSWYARDENNTGRGRGDQTFEMLSTIDNLTQDELRSHLQKELVLLGKIKSVTAYEDGDIDFEYFDVSWWKEK